MAGAGGCDARNPPAPGGVRGCGCCYPMAAYLLQSRVRANSWARKSRLPFTFCTLKRSSILRNTGRSIILMIGAHPVTFGGFHSQMSFLTIRGIKLRNNWTSSKQTHDESHCTSTGLANMYPRDPSAAENLGLKFLNLRFQSFKFS